MNNFTEFNILGKVDPSKTMITPNEFYFKLKEANALTNIDYEKLKTIMNDKNILEPTKEWLESEKDKHFQNLFKTLWPNIYDRINPPVQPQPTMQELISELEKKRAIYNLIAQQDLERHKASLAQSHLLSNYSNVYGSKYNDTLNICINGLNTGSPKVEISALNPPVADQKIEMIKYPNISSGYDYSTKSLKYIDDIVKSPYNPADFSKETELIKSIQETQEKLKISQKIEKTTDLVDDIIDKVKVLQHEMKKKSAEIKLQTDLEKLKKEHEIFHRCSSSLSDYLDTDKYHNRHQKHHYLNHKHHHHHHRSKSKERLSSYLSSDSSLERDERLRQSRSSILKNPKANVSFKYSSNFENKRNSSVGKPKISFSKSYVEPKVDCWNCNCKHDTNIY